MLDIHGKSVLLLNQFALLHYSFGLQVIFIKITCNPKLYHAAKVKNTNKNSQSTQMNATQRRNVLQALFILFAGIAIGWILRGMQTETRHPDRVYTSNDLPVIVSLAKETPPKTKVEQPVRAAQMQKYLNLAELYLAEQSDSAVIEVTKGVLYPNPSGKNSVKAEEASSYRSVNFTDYIASARGYLNRNEKTYLQNIGEENPLGLTIPVKVTAAIKESGAKWMMELTPDSMEIDFQSAFTSTKEECMAVAGFFQEFLKAKGVLFEEYSWK